MRRLLDEPALLFGGPVGPFAMNQYVVACPERREAAIVDAGGPPAEVLALAASEKLRVVAVLQTHAHVDHVAGVAATRRAIDAPVHLHAGDRPLWDSAAAQGRMFGLRCEAPPPPDVEVIDGTEVRVGSLLFRALHTPGHCPGHVCWYEESAGILFSGDLLFAGSIGRTDLPGADPALMKASLRRIMALPPVVRVFPGHMGATTVGREVRANPFLRDLDDLFP